jgi:hypothetical protein
MAYNIAPTGLDHFNTANNQLFTAMLIMLLVPYVGISLYTADKTMYLADASARRYRTSAYYVAKVCSYSDSDSTGMCDGQGLRAVSVKMWLTKPIMCAESALYRR